MEILYDKPYNESSSIKSENVQYSYNRGYSWFILRQAFSGRGAEILQRRCWYEKPVFFYKIISKPLYPTSYLNNNTHFSAYNTTMSCQITLKAESLKKFKTLIKKFVKVADHSIIAIYNLAGVKLLTRICVDSSHLNKHKFRVSPMCDWEIELTRHFSFRCPLFIERTRRFKKLS